MLYVANVLWQMRVLWCDCGVCSQPHACWVILWPCPQMLVVQRVANTTEEYRRLLVEAEQLRVAALARRTPAMAQFQVRDALAMWQRCVPCPYPMWCCAIGSGSICGRHGEEGSYSGGATPQGGW